MILDSNLDHPDRPWNDMNRYRLLPGAGVRRRATRVPTCRLAWPSSPKLPACQGEGDESPVQSVLELELELEMEVNAGAAMGYDQSVMGLASHFSHASTVSGNRCDLMLPFVGTLVPSLFVYLSNDGRSTQPVCKGHASSKHLAEAYPRPPCIASAAVLSAGYSVSSRMHVLTAVQGLGFRSVHF